MHQEFSKKETGDFCKADTDPPRCGRLGFMAAILEQSLVEVMKLGGGIPRHTDEQLVVLRGMSVLVTFDGDQDGFPEHEGWVDQWVPIRQYLPDLRIRFKVAG